MGVKMLVTGDCWWPRPVMASEGEMGTKLVVVVVVLDGGDGVTGSGGAGNGGDGVTGSGGAGNGGDCVTGSGVTGSGGAGNRGDGVTGSGGPTDSFSCSIPCSHPGRASWRNPPAPTGLGYERWHEPVIATGNPDKQGRVHGRRAM